MKIPTRITALLLAAVLTLSALGAAVFTVSAAEAKYEETDSYVLNYTNQDIEGYEDYDARRLYASDHYAGMYIDDDGDGTLDNWNWTCCSVLNMINTTKLAQGGEGPYASIPVYCVDAVTDGDPGHEYRRINLEDSGYFSAEVAGRLRSVFTHSFPYVTDMTVLAAAVNAWIAESGADYAEVISLQESEAITATQVAIWELANQAEEARVYDAYLGTGGYYNESEMVTEYLDIFRQEATEYTDNNTNALYGYLMDLDAAKAADVAVSDASLTVTGTDVSVNDDGTYNVTVTVDVAATIDAGDSLILSAVQGDKDTTVALNAAGEHTLTLSALTGLDDITVEINGYQAGGDVYLFDPLNGRTASQSMVGYDNSELPVHAEATVNPTDRILNIHKYSPIAGDSWEGKTPLANVEFAIYHVGTMEDYVNGKLDIGSVPTEEDVVNYATEDSLIAIVKTNSDGLASWNFGAVDGVYLVQELPTNPAVIKVADPFFVCVPTTGDNGEWDYIVDVYPKNDIISEDVKIEKDVTEIGNDHDTYDVGQIHTWIIQSSIPAGIASGLKYEISDTLDYRLTYQGNLLVTVAKTTDAAKTETVILTAAADYTVTETTAEDETYGTIYSFVVSLTSEGMQKVAEAAASNFNDYEVRIYFDAVIDADAQLGTEIPNQAHIDYTNAVGKDYEADSDIPEVHTGGLNLLKIDAADETKTLAGATFRIARAAVEGESADTTIMVNGAQVDVVCVSFYGNAALTGEKVTSVTTGEDGTAVFYGLAYGEYYLIETEAPAGYNKLTQPVAVEVTATSHLLDDPETEAVEESSWIIVKNSSEFELPSTGGMGTTIFTVAGLLLILGSGAALILRRRISAE